MKTFMKRLSYKHRIAAALVLITLIPCLFAELLYLQSVEQEWLQESLSDYQMDVDNVALAVSQSINGINAKMEYVRNSISFRNSLAQIDQKKLSQALDFIFSLDDLVEALAADNRSLEMRIYPHDIRMSYGSYCHTLNTLAGEFPSGWKDGDFQKILSLREGETLWQVREIKRNTHSTSMPEMRLCLYSQLKNPGGSDCVLEFSLPVSFFLKNRKTDSLEGSVFAFCLDQPDNSLDVILESDTAREDPVELVRQYRNQEIGKTYVLLSSSISVVSGSRAILLIPTAYCLKLNIPQITVFLLVSLLVLVMVTGASYTTAHLLTKRTIRAIQQIKEDLQYNTDEKNLSVYDDADLNQLSISIRKLVQATKYYCAQLDRVEAKSLRMELELLQMRFNPHLLYNTLGAIRYKIKDSDTRNTIDSLCHYYRIVLNNGHLIINLEDEIAMIREFLSIEKFSYQLNNISFEFDIDPRLSEHKIVKHLLQPIVENALNHGLRSADSEHNGILRISAFLKDSDICIQITDNGVGMTDDSIAGLLTAPPPSVAGHGYGIYNVQQRIRVYYGEPYDLHIDSTVGQGTTVTLTIPAIPPETA